MQLYVFAPHFASEAWQTIDKFSSNESIFGDINKDLHLQSLKELEEFIQKNHSIFYNQNVYKILVNNNFIENLQLDDSVIAMLQDTANCNRIKEIIPEIEKNLAKKDVKKVVFISKKKVVNILTK